MQFENPEQVEAAVRGWQRPDYVVLAEIKDGGAEEQRVRRALGAGEDPVAVTLAMPASVSDGGDVYVRVYGMARGGKRLGKHRARLVSEAPVLARDEVVVPSAVGAGRQRQTCPVLRAPLVPVGRPPELPELSLVAEGRSEFERLLAETAFLRAREAQWRITAAAANERALRAESQIELVEAEKQRVEEQLEKLLHSNGALAAANNELAAANGALERGLADANDLIEELEPFVNAGGALIARIRGRA
jgi:hypothetical protein